MSEIFYIIFGDGKDLTTLQMTARAVVIFISSLALIRIAGRRSFSLQMPIDNIIVILLGAVLSRAVVGASPFLPTLVASLVIVLLHRFLGVLSVHSEKLHDFIMGYPLCIFQNQAFIKKNMYYCQISEKDVLEKLRVKTGTTSLVNIEAIFVERSGELSFVKNHNDDIKI